MATSTKIALFCASIICVCVLFLIPIVEWIPCVMIPVYIVYGIIAASFFFLVFLLFKNAKTVSRILIVVEILIAIFICFISINLNFNPWVAKTFVKQIDDIYFYTSDSFPDPGCCVEIYEKKNGLPISIRRLRKQLRTHYADELIIEKRNDSILIVNTENRPLFYLQHRIPEGWKLIDIE